MKRVTIIGNAGGGKSILAKRLSQAKQLPLYAVDKFQWNPGWQPVPDVEQQLKLNTLLAGEQWIIDGWGPWDTVVKRIQESDTIVLIDLPLRVHLWWATKRQVRAFLLPWTIDKPAGCSLRIVTFRMYQMILRINRDLMPKLRALVASQEDGREVFHITSRAALRDFASDHC
jgi:adenylate kinase family enzyme